MSTATISLSVVHKQFVLQRSCVAAGVGALAGEPVVLWSINGREGSPGGTTDLSPQRELWEV